MMNLRESINRTVNLLSVTIVALAGFAFMAEIFLEDDVLDKIDDSFLLALGIYGIWWYLKGRNRFMRTMTPVVLVALGLLAKVGAVIVEFADPESVGDDFGGLILFALATALVYKLYRSAGRDLAGMDHTTPLS